MQFVFFGRPTLYGAVAGGLARVNKVIGIFRGEDQPGHGPDGVSDPRPARP